MTPADIHLLRAADSSKDQSYFLFTLGQAQLSRTLFPLGAMTKMEVRARARALGLANADKPESQEICFVPDGDYARFVERAVRRRGDSPGHSCRWPREIFSATMRESIEFTVGQRRGLGIAAAEPLYVREIRRQAARCLWAVAES